MTTAELDFNEHVKAFHPTGSRYICDPPQMYTDNDTVILADAAPFEDWLISNGWDSSVTEIEYERMGEFCSWRKGEENYIITESPEFYQRFVKATELAKENNLTAKADRIALFQKVLYNA